MITEGHTHSHSHDAPATEGRTIRWANHYDLAVKLLTFGREQVLRSQTIRQAAISEGATVLDVGCGTGTLTLLAKIQAGKQGKVYGIDAAPEMIEVARQKALHQQSEVDFQTAVIEALPFSDGKFDVILSSLMFHHLPGDLKERALAEMYRVLKPGGRVLIVDMKSLTGVARVMSIISLIHQGETGGVNDLAFLMKKVGYTETQAGNMQWGSIGFIQGKREAAV